MTLNETMAEYDGVEYSVRITNGGLIQAERELGKPISSFADPSKIGMTEMAAIVRYALHPVNNPKAYLSKESWTAILESENTAGFMELCGKVMVLMAENAKARENPTGEPKN